VQVLCIFFKELVEVKNDGNEGKLKKNKENFLK